MKSKTCVSILFTIFAVACLSVACSDTNSSDDTNALVAEDQMVPDAQDPAVTIASVTARVAGFVVIREDAVGSPGSVIGTKSVDAGLSTDVEVELSRNAVDGETLYAMLHVDDPADGVFTYEVDRDEDVPAVDDDEPVFDRFTLSTVGCIDNDNDGFGTGETIAARATCSQCENFGRCGVDCDDNDPSVNPGALEQCNGRDDNCDGEIDEPNECSTDRDCGPNDGRSIGLQTPEFTTVRCEDEPTAEDPLRKTCQVFMTTQSCPGGLDPCPCSAEPQLCTNGSFPDIPDPSECLP